MFALRNFSVCVALVSMVTFSMTGCCGGKCGLFGGGAAVGSHAVSAPASSGCTTCGTSQSSYSVPSESYSAPTYDQGYSSVPTSAGSGTVNAPSVSVPSAGSGTVNLPSVSVPSAGSGTINVPSSQGFGSGQNLPSFGGGSGSR